MLGAARLGLEFEDEAQVGLMGADVVEPTIPEDVHAEQAHDRILVRIRPKPLAQPFDGLRGQEGFQRQPDHLLGFKAQHLAAVLRGVLDDPVRRDRDQTPKGLDVAENVDRFAIAVGQVNRRIGRNIGLVHSVWNSWAERV